MEPELKANILAQDKWIRIGYLILFAVINYGVQLVSWGIGLFQSVAVLISNQPNQRLIKFGDQLSRYSAQIIAFITYSSEVKPYPVSNWPSE